MLQFLRKFIVVTTCFMLGLAMLAASAPMPTTAASADKVTKVRVNGLFADALLHDGDTNGFLNASRDQITNTSALDFAYAFPDPANPDFVILIQGTGEIPNSAFTITSTTAHLEVTTTFPINRCVVNTETGEFTCAPTTPITFNLSWVKDGFESVSEKTRRITTFGPITEKFGGEFTRVSAIVNGTWDVFTATDISGNLLDTRNTSIIREVTLKANP